MSQLESLRSHLGRLEDKAAKAVEKKLAIEALDTALSSRDVVRLLDSSSGKALSWKGVFSKVESYFYKETQNIKKPNQGVPVVPVSKRNAFSMVQRVVSTANRNTHQPRLDIDALLSFILTLVENEALYFFGPQLISLIQDFLSISLYMTLMSGHQWNDLIKGLLRMLHRQNSAPKLLVLEALNTAIVHGSDYTSVIPLLRKEVLGYFEKGFSNKDELRQFGMQYLEGFLQLCKHNAVEFRGLLCSKGETIIPQVRSIINAASPDEQDKACELFLVQMKLHMPCNVKPGSPAFYCNDMPKWSNTVKDLYEFCLDAIGEIARKRKLKGLKISTNLLLLAVKCTAQVVNFASTHEVLDNEENEQPPAKKNKPYKTFRQTIYDTCCMSNEAEQSIWLFYIEAVLDQFPDLIDSDIDFATLMKTATSLLTSTTAVSTDMFSFLRCLLNCEEHLLKTNILREKSTLWNYVWDIVIRSLSVNESNAEALQLLQAILVKFQPTNVNALLSLYVNDSLPLEKNSLNLLQAYLLNCTLPTSVSTLHSSKLLVSQINENSWCPRQLLLKWLMSDYGVDSDCGTLIYVLQCALLVKRTNLLLISEGLQYQKPQLKMSYIEEFEKIFITCSFESQLLENLSEESTSVKTTDSSLARLVRTFVDSNTTISQYLEFLRRDYNNIPIREGNVPIPELLKEMRHLLFRVRNYLHLLNCLEKYNIEASDTFNFKASVEKLFNSSLKLYLTKVNTYISRKKEIDDNLLTIVHGVRSLFRNISCEETKNLLVANFPPALMSHLLERFKNKFKSNESQKSDSAMSIDDEGNLEGIEKRNLCCLEILRCLCDFGLLSSCDYRLNLFLDIISCLQKSCFSLINQFQFDVCAELVIRLIPMISLFPKLIDPIFDLLKSMLTSYCKNKVCALKLWDIVEMLIPAVNKLHCDSNVFERDPPKVRLMGLIRRYVFVTLSHFKNSHAITIWRKISAVMSQLAKNDCNLSWSFCAPQKGTAEKTWPLLELYQYLKIPSHQVRLFLIDTLCCIFQNVTSPMVWNSQILKPTHSIMEEFFTRVYETILNSSNVPRDLSAAETNEEEVNYIAFALLCLSRIIFSSSYIQQLAIFHFVLIVKIKSIGMKLSHDALQRAHPRAFEIIVYNGQSVLEMWLEEKQHIKNFPFELLDCSDYESFLKKFQSHLVVRLFELNRLNELEEIAKICKMTSQACIQKNFAKIIARNAATHVSQCGSNERSSSWYEVHMKLVDAVGGKENFNQLLKTTCGDIILEECSILYDPKISDQLGYPELTILQPKPVSFREEDILNSLESLKNTMKISGHSVIDSLAISSPKVIHSILIKLTRRVHEAYDIVQRFRTLHHFSFFVQILMDGRDSTFALTKDYVCHFVIYAYLRFLSFTDHDGHFLRAVVIVLTQFIEKLVVIVPKELEHYYGHIVSKLTALSTHPQLADILKIPLDCLLVHNKDKFSICIASLDPFPDDVEMFQDYKASHRQERYKKLKDSPSCLSTELKSCLVEVKNSNNICTKERLQHIRKLLIEGQEEFASIVKGLEKKRFHDECTQDLVHNLLQLFVDIINKTENEDVRNEAARCLGEIGPIDLSVLVLPHGDKTKLTSISTIVPSMIDHVITYIADDNITVAETASNVMTNLLRHQEYNDYLKSSDCNPRLPRLLTPFQSSQTVVQTVEKISVHTLKAKLDEMEENVSYSTWITSFTCGLISSFLSEGSMISKLQALCILKAEFCEDVLPFVVKSVLYNGRLTSVRTLITNYFQNFFSQFVGNISIDEARGNVTPSLSSQSSIYTNKLALRCLLRVVQYLRIHDIPEEFKRHKSVTPWDNNFWLDLNYMDVAKAAQYCGAFLSSILYIEIFALENELTPEDMINVSSEEEKKLYCATIEDSLGDSRTKSFNIYKLLLKAYTSIGEEDGVYGCGSARFSDFQSSIQHLEQLNCWNQVLSAVDAHGPQNQIRICNSLKNLGLYNSLWTHLRGIETQNGSVNDELQDVQYECGWRLSNWEINSEKVNYIKDPFGIDRNGVGGGPFQKFLYESIQAGLKGDHSGYDQNIRRGFHIVVNDLKHASLESSENLYKFLSQFQMLRVVENIFEADQENIESISRKWKNHNLFTSADFKYQEPVLYMKKTLLNAFNTKHPNVSLTEACNDILFDLLVMARNSSPVRLELAEKYASEINESSVTFVRKQLEIARNHWVRGSKDIAKHILDKLIQKQSPEECQFYPTLLLQYGKWLYETLSERPTTVFQDYLIKSCELLEKKSHPNSSEVAEAHLVVAKYADSQYQKLVDYMQSDLYREKKHLYNKSKEEQSKTQSSDNDTRKSLHFMRKQNLIDNEEMQSTIVEKTSFKHMALRHYMRALNNSTENDLLIFRCIALWLENSPNGEGDVPANKIVADEPMPAYKYIGVLHQLSARLGSSNIATTELLSNIILQCAELHPFHTLPVILTQAMLYKDKEIVGKSTNKKAVVSGQERITAAVNILTKLRKGKKSELTLKMEKLWEALIVFANTQEATKGDQRKSIPSNTLISSLRSLENIPVLTLPFPISPNGKYNVIGIQSFGKQYGLVGGINSPKKLTCRGTNGMNYNMLLKGNDDLRQDAVMQQVFSAMNTMLSTDPKIKKRRLLVRTYKVVPLSQRSGIIEWCENTQTFGDYLIGSAPTNVGAHALYRPSDYKPIECRRIMTEVKDCGDAVRKHETFLKIMEKFKPVFRHFFFDNFKDAGSFFERRLAYTRSVATSSMVGYMLGIGDRHVLNILVDKLTAEFIHIDLGVAFDQGQVLPTPETIPFRLTRDVVDGMGVCGTEGVFRRSCEMTLEVLRQHCDIILTILEVLLYDPLYLWTLTDDRKQKIQSSDSRAQSRNSSIFGELETEQRNNSAARELRRLRCKLAGIHEGGASGGTSMSVSGHVAILIQQAVDTARLCRLFPGWQPYL